MTYAYHSTWLVNSATHLWGYRNYETRDHSRNLWWVALVSYGEGWHNNHHAHPANARAGAPVVGDRPDLLDHQGAEGDRAGV